MISKDEFIKRATEMELTCDPAIFQEVDTNWDRAVRAAGILESQMPGIGILSESKRIGCFLAVCSQIDRLMESEQFTFEAARLAVLILLVTSTDFSKAYALFMHRAPDISWQEAIDFPRMALEFFKAARGQ